jgi:hypothetical protein
MSADIYVIDSVLLKKELSLKLASNFDMKGVFGIPTNAYILYFPNKICIDNRTLENCKNSKI